MSRHAELPGRPGWAPLASWTAALAAMAAAILVLHALGDRPGFDVRWSDLSGWLAEHSTEQAVLAVGRVVALGAAYMIVLGTVIDMTARLTGLPSLLRSVEWATLPPVRRLAERVAAVAIGTASIVAPSVGAVATPIGSTVQVEPPGDAFADPVVFVVDDARDLSPRPPAGSPATGLPITLDLRADPDHPGARDDLVADADGPAPAASGQAAAVGAPPLPFLVGATPTAVDADPLGAAGSVEAVRPAATLAGVRPTARPAAATAPTDHVVVPGDHLWGISVERLTAAFGRAPSEVETATYWSELVDANRSTLRSGDPDLIFPGEVVTCPPVNPEP